MARAPKLKNVVFQKKKSVAKAYLDLRQRRELHTIIHKCSTKVDCSFNKRQCINVALEEVFDVALEEALDVATVFREILEQ